MLDGNGSLIGDSLEQLELSLVNTPTALSRTIIETESKEHSPCFLAISKYIFL
jgi:hypothetical protein